MSFSLQRFRRKVIAVRLKVGHHEVDQRKNKSNSEEEKEEYIVGDEHKKECGSKAPPHIVSKEVISRRVANVKALRPLASIGVKAEEMAFTSSNLASSTSTHANSSADGNKKNEARSLCAVTIQACFRGFHARHYLLGKVYQAKSIKLLDSVELVLEARAEAYFKDITNCVPALSTEKRSRHHPVDNIPDEPTFTPASIRWAKDLMRVLGDTSAPEGTPLYSPPLVDEVSEEKEDTVGVDVPFYLPPTYLKLQQRLYSR